MKSNIRKPMLAVAAKMDKIKYPVLATPKLDGIRCLIIDGKPVSRTFKPIANNYIREKLAELPSGLDGELMSGDNFSMTTSAVMKSTGEPNFEYHVFDYVEDGVDLPYRTRMQDLKELDLPDWCVKVLPKPMYNYEDMVKYEEGALELGYEGIMIRTPNSPYKCGRSTVNEGYLLKIKRFLDSEAVIVGFEEKMHNENEAEEDAFGRTKRSTKKEGKRPAGTLGALQVVDNKSGIAFNIGTGFDDALRKLIWDNKDTWLDKLVKYKYQGVEKDKPRFPVFLGFRDKRDM